MSPRAGSPAFQKHPESFAFSWTGAYVLSCSQKCARCASCWFAKSDLILHWKDGQTWLPRSCHIVQDTAHRYALHSCWRQNLLTCVIRQDRRRIEQEMFNGQLLGIVATTALELGIDIGSLDAVITVGFPYTLPGLRQQAGRAGRRNKDSLAMLICDPFPIE